MSQLIIRLDREFERTPDRETRAEILARKACALTRAGRFAEASSLILSIRETYGDWSSARTHAWIMLAEGVHNWYSDLSLQALDRVTRAQVLLVAVGDGPATATVAAWKAHLEFFISDFAGMFRSLQLAIDRLTDDNNEAKIRIVITLCNICSICGEWDRVLEWFNLGRKFAIAGGDLSSIEALQYNRAALAGAWVRVEHFHNGVDHRAIRATRLELESSKNFQALMPTGALTNHLVLCDARLRMIEGDFVSAITEFSKARGSRPFSNYASSESLIDIEIAYCKFMIGDHDAAFEEIRNVSRSSLIDVEIDDLFVATCLLHEMSVKDERFGDAADLARNRSELREAYIKSRQELESGFLALPVQKLSHGTLGTSAI